MNSSGVQLINLLWLLLIVLIVVPIAIYCFRMEKSDQDIFISMKALGKYGIDWSWSFIMEHKNWEIDQRATFYLKYFNSSSIEYKRVINLFDNYLDGNQIPITNVIGVYSMSLYDGFLSSVKLTENKYRSDKNLFMPQGWKKNKNGLREWVYEEFDNYIHRFPWNEGKPTQLCIFPMIHGTSKKIAMSIASTGFVALSKLDEGWYGKGIYFTSSARYSIPYFAIQKEPVIIISYIIGGNVYPVIEHPQEPNNLKGSPTIVGYNAHYVLTKKSGYPVTTIEGEHYDELVIEATLCCLPAFILEVHILNLQSLVQDYQRETMS